MSAGMIAVDARELGRLNRNLRAYLAISKKTEDEILNKKGNDLRIKLFQGFWKQRWKKGNKGGGMRLLKNLAKSGKGIHVRLLSLVSPWSSRIPDVDKNGKKLTLWQKLVTQELLRRQAGVGVLGVSFLRKRWRYTNQKTYLSTNNTRGFGKAVTFEKRDGAFIITGFTPGLASVAQKYGVLETALRFMSFDMEKYLARKIGPALLKQIHAP